MKRTASPAMLAHDMTLRAQVAMLLWFDVTLAIITRKIMILPSPYLVAFIDQKNMSCEWDYFSFTGFHEEIFRFLSKLFSLCLLTEITIYRGTNIKRTRKLIRNCSTGPCRKGSMFQDLKDLFSRQLEYIMNRIYCTEA